MGGKAQGAPLIRFSLEPSILVQGIITPDMVVSRIHALRQSQGFYEPVALTVHTVRGKRPVVGNLKILRTEDAMAAAGALTFMMVAGCPLMCKLTVLARVLGCRSFQQKNNLLRGR